MKEYTQIREIDDIRCVQDILVKGKEADKGSK